MNAKDKKALKDAKTAVNKLNNYSDGHSAAGGKNATAKYNDLNSKADAAVRKLPAHLRARIIVELLG